METGFLPVEECLGGLWGIGKQSFQEGERLTILAFCGGDQRQEDAYRFGTLLRAAAEAYLPENDREAQGLFGMVVGRFHTWDSQKGEHPMPLALRIEQALPEFLGLLVSQRMQADRLEQAFEAGKVLHGLILCDSPRVARCGGLTRI